MTRSLKNVIVYQAAEFRIDYRSSDISGVDEMLRGQTAKRLKSFIGSFNTSPFSVTCSVQFKASPKFP